MTDDMPKDPEVPAEAQVPAEDAVAPATPVAPVKPGNRRMRAFQKLFARHPVRTGLLTASPFLTIFLVLLTLAGLGYMAFRQFYVTNNRIRVFHELEMYEGDVAIEAIRLIYGEQIYPDIQGEYIPVMYTPLFPYLTAASMRIVDKPGAPHTLYAGRLVSVIFTWVCILVILAWVFRETGNALAATVAAGFFVGINPFIGWWFDLCRVDMVFMACTGLGAWALMDRRSPGTIYLTLENGLGRSAKILAILLGVLTLAALIIWLILPVTSLGANGPLIKRYAGSLFFVFAVLAGLLGFTASGEWSRMDRQAREDISEAIKGILAGFFFVMAFFAKQTGGQIAVVFTALAVLHAPYRALWAAASGLGFGVYGMLYLNWVNESLWYNIYTIPSKQGYAGHDVLPMMLNDFIKPLAVPIAIIAGWTVLVIYRRQWRRLLLIAALVGEAFVSVRGRITIGGYINHYMPIFFFHAVVLGIALGSMLPPLRSVWSSRRIMAALAGAAVILAIGAAVLIPRDLIKPKPNGARRAVIGADKPFTANYPLGFYVLIGGLVAAVGLAAQPRARTAIARSPQLGFVPALAMCAATVVLMINTNTIKWPEVKKQAEGKFWKYPDKIADSLKWERQLQDLRFKIPARADVQKGREFIEGIRALDGNVWIPHENYYTYLAKGNYDISGDILWIFHVAAQSQIPPYVFNMLNSKKYKYIFLNNVNIDQDWMAQPVMAAIKKNYRFHEDWEKKYGWMALRPVDSTGQKPRALLIRNDAPEASRVGGR